MALLKSGTRIYGNATVDTILVVDGQDAATSNTTGALKVAGGVGVTGNIFTSANIYAANANLGNVATANYVAGTLTTAYQPNITGLGNLTNLTVTGNTTLSNVTAGDGIFTGNLIVGGTLEYTNVTNLYIKDPIIEQGGDANAGALTTDDNMDRGSILHYYDGKTIDAFIGWKNANSEFVIASNVSITDNIVTINELGNLRGNIFIGNLYGTANNAVTVTASSQPNITSVGTLGNLSVTNDVSASTLTGTLTTNAQPNITSVGTLANLTVSGLKNFGYPNTIRILGGTDGSILTTDGSGNLSWSPPGAGSGNANVAGSNTQIQYNNGTNLGASANLTFDATTKTLTVDKISSDGGLLSNITGGNVTGQVANALIAGTVYTNAQPNITSLGTLTSLAVTGNIATGNANLGNLATANYFSGDATYLSNITGGNVTGQVGNALMAATVYTNAQPNITSVGNLTNLRVTGNIRLDTGLSINGDFGQLGQVLTAKGDNTVYWSTRFFYGNLPPQAYETPITPNYGDIWYYVDNDLDPPISKLYMWVNDGTSEYFYDFLPPAG